ncbi:MAG: TRAP transporter substrate-binding protein [Acetobacteraceae bacterium]
MRLVGAGLAAPLVARFAHAADIAWRIGHTAPASFPVHRRLVEAAEAIGRESDGRMAVRVFPDSELGSQIGLLAQIRAGSLDASPITGQVLAGAQAAAALPMVGFAWSGYETLWRAIDGELGKLIRDQLTRSTRLIAMDRCWDFGFRVISTQARPVSTPKDLIGLRLRTPVEAELVGLFQALKALPLAMPLGEVYPALRRRQADGQEGVMPLIFAARLYEVQDTCSLTNHVWDGQWICIAPTSWNRLPDRLKEIVARALDAAGLRQREDTVQGNQEVRDILVRNRMAFNTVEQAPFRDVLRQAGYYREWRQRFGEKTWDVLERYAGRLA